MPSVSSALRTPEQGCFTKGLQSAASHPYLPQLLAPTGRRDVATGGAQRNPWKTIHFARPPRQGAEEPYPPLHHTRRPPCTVRPRKPSPLPRLPSFWGWKCRRKVPPLPLASAAAHPTRRVRPVRTHAFSSSDASQHRGRGVHPARVTSPRECHSASAGPAVIPIDRRLWVRSLGSTR